MQLRSCLIKGSAGLALSAKHGWGPGMEAAVCIVGTRGALGKRPACILRVGSAHRPSLPRHAWTHPEGHMISLKFQAVAANKTKT